MEKTETHTLGLEPEEVKNRILKIGSQLKDRDAKWLWETYSNISGNTKGMPCLCPSSARQWTKAFSTIQEWLRENEKGNDGGEQ